MYQCEHNLSNVVIKSKENTNIMKDIIKGMSYKDPHREGLWKKCAAAACTVCFNTCTY